MSKREEIQAEVLENNYNLIIRYYKQMKDGKLSSEEYIAKKTWILEDIIRDIQLNKSEGKRSISHEDCVYFILSMLYETIKAITKEDFEHYTENI